MPTHTEHLLPARAVTRSPGHHLLCYYDKCPWDRSGRFLLALRADVGDRDPDARDAVDIGCIDLQQDCRWEAIASTHAWNFHTGSYVMWLGDSSTQVIYPVRREEEYVSVLHDLATGARREVPYAAWAVHPLGREAMCIDFVRNYAMCSTGGFFSPTRTREALLAEMADSPDDEGIRRVTLDTGAAQLIVSLHHLAQRNRVETMNDARHGAWYIKYNPGGTRILFVHSWRANSNGMERLRLYTVNTDGSELYCLADEQTAFSHPHWYDDQRVVAYVWQQGIGHTYTLFRDRTGERDILWGPDVISGDGHSSPSPDGQWLLSDTYPHDDYRTVLLLHHASKRRIDIGHFRAPTTPANILRCDLHPRWSPDGCSVAVTSACDGTLQVYIVDVSAITGA